jgi:hypothetical protein
MIDPITEYILEQEWADSPDPTLSQAVDSLSNHFLGVRVGTALKGAAAVTAMIAISYRYYKYNMSKAAKACKGKVGEDLKVCMKKYKQDALKKRMEVLNKAYAACSKSNNPITCKSKIDKERNKVKKKMRRIVQ